MKKSQPKTIYITTVLLFLAAFAIYSCKKELKGNAPAPGGISDAQKWYESTYPKSINSSSLLTQSFGGGRDLSQIIKPDWKHTKSYTRLGQKVIEMPVDPSAKLNLNLKTDKWVFNKNYSRSSFLIINDSNKYNAYILTFIADSDYVKNDTSKLAHNSYRKLDADYSGLILYFTPKGDYLGGYGYKDGQLVVPEETTEQTGSQKIQSVNKGTLKPDNMVADCVDWYHQTTIWLEDGSVWTSDWEYFDTICTYRDDGSGTGSGGNTPPQNPPPAPICPPGTGNPSPCTPVTMALKGNNLVPPGGGGGDGGAPPPPPTTSTCTVTGQDCPTVTIKDDSLAKHFPCAVKLILNALLSNANYNSFVAPFNTSRKPDITWSNAPLDWKVPNPNGSGTITMLGNTSTSATNNPNNVDRNADITLNTSMLQNSTQLMIAATAIHETLHAYIHYNIVTAVGFSQPQGYTGNGTWLYSLDTWATMQGLPSNYSNHYQMLSDYFSQSVSILKSWDHSAHTDKEYAMAMLYGLNNGNDGNATQKALLQTEFNNICSTYNITTTDLNTFYTNQLTATSNKLPTSGC